VIKILFVDDNKRIRINICEFLEDSSYEIVQAENGEEAVRLFRKYRPDIVFMDIIMPVLDGITASDKLTDEFPDAVIILMNSMGVIADSEIKSALISSAFQRGVKDYINKPVSVRDINIMIKKYTEQI